MLRWFAKDQFAPQRPWAKPALSECRFYTSFDFPDGEQVSGNWDFRGRFDDYIGHYPVAGKTVLDMGTASGWLAFEAEKRGALVTAFEAANPLDLSRVPFADSHYWTDREAWAREFEVKWHRPLKAGYWYAWHKFGSKVEAVYAKLEDTYRWERKFDVVFAGAILEHLADPVSAIGLMARLARETLIIAFTPIDPTPSLTMRPSLDWKHPQADFSWWMLSEGLYRRILENLGFSIEITHCTGLHSSHPLTDGVIDSPSEQTRPTIVARRK